MVTYTIGSNKGYRLHFTKSSNTGIIGSSSNSTSRKNIREDSSQHDICCEIETYCLFKADINKIQGILDQLIQGQRGGHSTDI